MTVITSDAVKGRMLKIKFGELLSCIGGVEAAAAFCRVGKSSLARYASLVGADADCFAPVDVVHDLERLAGKAPLTEHLCTLAEGVFVSLPAAPATREDLLTLLADQAREQSDLTQAICTGLADGRFDRKDAAKALAEVEDVIRVAAAMRAELMTIVEGE